MKHLSTIALLLAAAITCINAQTTPCDPATKSATLDINNVSAGLLNGGDLWWNLQASQYEVPKGSNRYSLFAGGFWIGGIDDGGQLRVAGQTYRQVGNDFWPGPIMDNGSTDQEMCSRFDALYNILRTEVDLMADLGDQYDVASGGTIPESEIPQNVKRWPAIGNPFFEDANNQPYTIEQDLAPFVDVDGNGSYDPAKGDYPNMRGDEMFWWVFNDIGNNHGETDGQPLGIEVHASAYAYSAANDDINHTTFYRFKVQNKTRDFDTLRLGMFVDFDLGNYMDDYVGCDTTRDLGIGYNGDANDDGPFGYGEDPPFIGVDFLNVSVNGQTGLGMSNFMYYNNDFSNIGNPESARDYYDYLSSVWKDGKHMTWGGNGYNGGTKTDHIFPSEPNEPNGWSECQEGNNPFDRRMVIGSGPYALKIGESITLDFAAIWARCPDYEICPSFDCIQDASDYVQTVFDTEILPTGIADQPKHELRVSPNPAIDKLQLKVERAGEYQFEIYNATGQLVQQGKFSGNETVVNTAKLAGGMYFLSINNGLIVEKVMVQSR